MEGKGQNQLTGTVSHVIFQNKENGYTVLRLKTGQEEVTAVGILPQVTQGEQVILEGSWTDHPANSRRNEPSGRCPARNRASIGT